MRFTQCKITYVAFFFVALISAPAQTFMTIWNFDGTNGSGPASLTQGIDGNYYGTTITGGSGVGCSLGVPGCGTAFRIGANGDLTTIYDFCSQPNCADGYFIVAGLDLGFDGNFYGTSGNGGANCPGYGCGTIYRLMSGGHLSTIHSFCGQPNCTDGNGPLGPLVQGSDGNFYGTTATGGANSSACNDGCGTVFKITPNGSFTTLYSFCAQSACSDGSYPEGGLVQANDGNLYGTTSMAGSTCQTFCYGTVFRITPAGKLTTLHRFSGGDGREPIANLIQGLDGNLYGTTYGGGGSQICNSAGCGTIFKITLTGQFTKLYKFTRGDGAYPAAPLVQGTDGNFYGTTFGGGNPVCTSGCGTVFEITPSGTLTTLHEFQGGDGENPNSGLLQATSGTFYGTTYEGGSSNNCSPEEAGCGTVFSLDIGLGPFISFVRNPAKSGQMFGILGQDLSGSTSVLLNGTPALFTVKSDTLIIATVPPGATTGYVTVNTPSGTMTSNVPFVVIP